MKIFRIYNVKPLRWFKIRGMTVYPVILFGFNKDWFRENREDGFRLFRHEWYHVQQIRQMGWWAFYWNWFFGDRHVEKDADNAEFTPLPDEGAELYEADIWTQE